MSFASGTWFRNSLNCSAVPLHWQCGWLQSRFFFTFCSLWQKVSLCVWHNTTKAPAGTKQWSRRLAAAAACNENLMRKQRTEPLRFDFIYFFPLSLVLTSRAIPRPLRQSWRLLAVTNKADKDSGVADRKEQHPDIRSWCHRSILTAAFAFIYLFILHLHLFI